MLLESLLVLQSAAPSAAPGEPGFMPVACSSAEMKARFPAEWRLPIADKVGRELPNARFAARLIRLTSQPLADADAAFGRPALMLGDLLARANSAAQSGTVAEARLQLDALLTESQELVPASLWHEVAALLDLRDFVSPKWDPDDEDERSGFLMGETWELPTDCWPIHEGSRQVEQCAVFMAADLAAIKVCESDFSRYLQYAGNSYLSVDPVAGSCFFTIPETGPSQASGWNCAASISLSVEFRSDLPFPFGSYEMLLHYFSDLDPTGRPRTWVYSDSPAFHWLAGCDLYEPVVDGAGNFVGTLVIRQCGADLDGVPDRSSHRQSGMRVSLGGLRRDAEARFRAQAGAAIFPARGFLPVCPILAPAR